MSGVGGSTTDAEAWFEKALETARAQRVHSLELRAMIDLAHMYRDVDRGTEAVDRLGSIYGVFTEGLDTVDVKEAREILDALP